MRETIEYKIMASGKPKFENSKCEICGGKVCYSEYHRIYDTALARGLIIGKTEGFLEGIKRHTWMKNGITYVGNGTYTLKEAIELAKRDKKITPTEDKKRFGCENYPHPEIRDFYASNIEELLKEIVPEKDFTNDIDEYGRAERNGWNACIDQIQENINKIRGGKC